MVQKNLVIEETVKHKGFFNFSELYTYMYQWLKDEGYMVREEEYQEKVAGTAKEIRIKWVGVKKVTDYLKNSITVKWHIIAMTEAEVERDGKKEKGNKGDLKLVFTGELEKDYEKRWETNAMYKFFRGIYDHYIIKTTIDEYEDRLWDKTESYIENVKAFLVLEGRK